MPSDKIFLVFCFLQEFLLYFSIFRKAARRQDGCLLRAKRFLLIKLGEVLQSRRGPRFRERRKSARKPPRELLKVRGLFSSPRGDERQGGLSTRVFAWPFVRCKSEVNFCRYWLAPQRPAVCHAKAQQIFVVCKGGAVKGAGHCQTDVDMDRKAREPPRRFSSSGSTPNGKSPKSACVCARNIWKKPEKPFLRTSLRTQSRSRKMGGCERRNAALSQQMDELYSQKGDEWVKAIVTRVIGE